MLAPEWNSLKAGNLDKRKATLGLSPPSTRKVNTRQYRFPFSTLNTNVTDLANYYLIDQPGMAFGLNPASDPSAVAIVHVDYPGNPVYITPGTPKDIPAGFTRLYLERPTQPPVPNRADLYYIFDTSDRVGGVQYGPLPLGLLHSGADDYTAPGAQLVTRINGGAAGVPTVLMAAQPGRRSVTITNVSTAGETIWITLDTTTNQVWDPTDPGVIEELGPGESITLEYTGAVAAFASAATALASAFQLK